MLSWIQKPFYLDLRSIALFRVLLSLILIYDFLWTRLPYYKLFHTPEGLVSLETILSKNPLSIFLLFLSENSILLFLFFCLTLVFSFLLLIGYKSKSSSFLCLCLLWLFQSQSPLILSNTDQLIKLFLFWACFLPLGGVWSVDRALSLSQKKKFQFLHASSFLFISQIVLVYILTGLMAWNRSDGPQDVMGHLLSLEQSSKPFGTLLAQWPSLTETLTFLKAWVFELTLPLMVYFAFFKTDLIRILVISAMYTFHIVLYFSLSTGVLPFLSIALWSLLLPSSFWTQLKKWGPRNKDHDIKLYFDEECVFCKKSVFLLKTFLIIPQLKIFPAQSQKEISKKMKQHNSWVIVFNNKYFYKWEGFVLLASNSFLLSWLTPLFNSKIIRQLGNSFYTLIAFRRNVLSFTTKPFHFSSKNPSDVPHQWTFILFLFFTYILIHSFTNDEKSYNLMNSPPNKASRSHFWSLDQYKFPWVEIPEKSFWVVFSGKTKNEEKINLFRPRRPLSFEKPSWHYREYPSFRHRNILENLLHHAKSPSIKAFANYVCTSWNESTSLDKVDTLEIFFMIRAPRNHFNDKVTRASEKKHLMISHQCL